MGRGRYHDPAPPPRLSAAIHASTSLLLNLAIALSILSWQGSSLHFVDLDQDDYSDSYNDVDILSQAATALAKLAFLMALVSAVGLLGVVKVSPPFSPPRPSFPRQKKKKRPTQLTFPLHLEKPTSTKKQTLRKTQDWSASSRDSPSSTSSPLSSPCSSPSSSPSPRPSRPPSPSSSVANSPAVNSSSAQAKFVKMILLLLLHTQTHTVVVVVTRGSGVPTSSRGASRPAKRAGGPSPSCSSSPLSPSWSSNFGGSGQHGNTRVQFRGKTITHCPTRTTRCWRAGAGSRTGATMSSIPRRGPSRRRGDGCPSPPPPHHHHLHHLHQDHTHPPDPPEPAHSH
ncbi:hypothetical protein T439DRAFT_77090 [Meredithblackwellia eburnea MCA 4105]